MKANKLLIALIGIAVATGAAAGMKGQGKGMNKNVQQPAFAQFDLNEDGVITSEEFNKARAERIQQRTNEGRTLRNINKADAFSEMDKDGDGVVTKDEFNARQQYMSESRKQKDSAYSKSKRDKANKKAMKTNRKSMKSDMQKPAFSNFDTDGNGMISPEEFDALRMNRQQDRADDNRMLKNRDKANAFASFDKNGDGVISEEEFQANQGWNNSSKGKGQGKKNRN